MASQETDRYCGSTPPPGASATARGFGADVAVADAPDGRSLFFVVGRTGPPDRAVSAVGGQVVTHLPDRRRVLAVAPLAAYARLSGDPAVALAGPVTIDPERFGHFAQLVALDASPQDT